MEDLLLQISNECSNNKLSQLKTASQTAYGKDILNLFQIWVAFFLLITFLNIPELLQSQNSLLREPAHELRAKCFNVFQIALETRKSKFVANALSGFHVSEITLCL